MNINYLTLYLFQICFIIIIGGLLKGFNSSSNYKITNTLIFLMVVLVAGLRYDTTTDYDNYIRFFLNIKEGVGGRFELGYKYLNLMFSGYEFGYIYVFFICSLFSIYAFYKYLLEKDIVFYGFIFFFLFGIFKDYDNLIRQSVSIGIFILGLKYALNGKIGKYILFGLFASFFHISAMFAFTLFYLLIKFFDKYDINFYSWLIIISAAYLGYLTGIFKSFSFYILTLIPQYAHYAENLKLGVTANLSSGLGILFWVILAVFIAYFRKLTSPKDYIYSNVAIASIVIYLLINDYILIERMVKYLFIFRVVAISFILKELKSPILKGLIILACLGFFIKTTVGYYGMNSYKTVFCEERKKWEVYDRKRIKDKFSPTSYRAETKILKH
jgi:hypothetical protein